MRTRTALITTLLALALPAHALAATITVSPGESIQKAVNKAKQHDNVRIKPGVYHEKAHKCPAEEGTCAVHISKGIRLRGLGKPGHPVVLEAKGDEHQGIEAARKGGPKCLHDKSLQIEDLEISGITVRGFQGDGVFVRCAVNWKIASVRAIRNDEYGIFPVFSGKGRVTHSFASGANDTGIYIGQSHDVQIDHNTAVNNVSGFELENTTRSVAEFNDGHDNTAGLLSFALPNLVVKVNRRNLIRGNVFHHNNRDNTCEDPDDVVCNVPPGTGIIMVATDRNTTTNNSVKNNRTGGIALVSYCIIADSPCKPDIDPNPDYNHIVANTVTGNGKNPAHPYEGIAADLIWDGSGKGNCWTDNIFGKSFPDELPSC
jgi:parallel beta-helix repeat protein